MNEEVPFNPDAHRNMAARRPELTISTLEDAFYLASITPATHPRVCDLCSGVGAVAGILVSRFGWHASDITCIDMYRPETIYVENAQWMFIDLVEANKNKELIAQLAGQFDLITAFHAYIPVIRELADYLLRGQGEIQNDVGNWILCRKQSRI